MTDKTKKTQESGTHLFENNLFFVTPEGEIKIKENNFFEERVIAFVDPDSLGEEMATHEKTFRNLDESLSSFLGQLSKKTQSDSDKIKLLAGELFDLATSAERAVNFDEIVTTLNEGLSAILAGKQQSESEPDVDKTFVNVEKDEITDEVPSTSETEDQSSDAESSGIAGSGISQKNNSSETADPDARNDDQKDPATGQMVTGSESEEALSDDSEPTEAAEKNETDAVAAEDKITDETPATYYRSLAEKAETLSDVSDWSYATMEFENINMQWEAGPETEGADLSVYREKIDLLRQQLEEKKRAHYEEQKRIREQNLEKKKDLLKQLRNIIDEEKWAMTREVSKIRNRWDQIKPLPAGEQENLDIAFNEFLKVFEDHKVDRLVKQKQQEEDNLTGKLVILERMEKFLESADENSDWIELDKKIAEYVRQFRKIGRIPAEKNQETWDRFHAAQDAFHDLRFKFDKKYRKDIEKFLSRKKKLIDEAEALIDTDDLPKAARKINKLHRQWKKTGNLPKKDENDLWDRFKAATDAFNEKKSENIDQLRDQEDENFEKKLILIAKADELKESEEWEETHKEFQQLMDRWKATGPVPRRKSGKIWKQFKSAMDHFYDRRRDFFKEVKEERKDNLKEKETILEQLRELQKHENPIEAVELAKPLQTEFKKAGYVPIKHKNRMWKEYREICDVIYERFRTKKSAADIVGKANVEHYTTDDLTEIKKRQEIADKLRKEVGKLSSELIQMKESLSYFKPSGKGSSLLDDVRSRIDKAEEDLNRKEEKLQNLEIEIDKIKRSS